MVTPKAYKVLATEGAGLLLASDFPATGRTVASFHDLFSNTPHQFTIWETTPPPVGDELDMAGPDYVDRWSADVVAAGSPVGAVVGFCVGAVFAAALAARLDAQRVVLFDPELPGPDLLLRHYHSGFDTLSAIMSAAEMVSAREAGTEARKSTEDMSQLAELLCVLLAEHGAPAMQRSGLDPRRQEELFDTFASFISYLVAAADLDPLPVWARATAVSSATLRNGLNPLPPEQRATLVAREVRFNVDHADLLRDRSVAGTTGELLAPGDGGQ